MPLRLPALCPQRQGRAGSMVLSAPSEVPHHGGGGAGGGGGGGTQVAAEVAELRADLKELKDLVKGMQVGLAGGHAGGLNAGGLKDLMKDMQAGGAGRAGAHAGGVWRF